MLSSSALFSNIATTDAGTHTSMHSIFCSAMPTCNGAAGWALEALRNFNQEIYTITDIFKMNGYKTFRYCDADAERTVPMSGFDIWEASGFKISDLIRCTDHGKTHRRENFIDEVNRCKDKKFVYHHNLLLHELNASMGYFWTSKQYLENIKTTSEYFRELYNEYNISDDDIVIISSDHGVLLDMLWLDARAAATIGERHYEQSVQAFWSIQGKNIPAKVLDKRISALDIAPTLLEIVFNNNFRHQGHSQTGYLFNDDYRAFPCFREKGTYNAPPELQNPMTSDVFYVWENNWKYVYGTRDSKCEWLIDLEHYQDYSMNLKEKYPEKVKYFRDLIQKNILEPDIKQYITEDREKNLPAKKDIAKFFSLVISKNLTPNLWDDVIDFAGPYYEILCTCPEVTVPGKFRHHYKINMLKINSDNSDIMRESSGEWVIFLNKKFRRYTEFFLSDLYRFIAQHDGISKIKGRGFTAVKKNFTERIDFSVKASQVRLEDKNFRLSTRIYKFTKRVLRGIKRRAKKLLAPPPPQQYYLKQLNSI